MKKNDSGDFSVLYVELADDKATLFQVIAEQQKPVVIMLAEQLQVLQRPDDFTALKLLKRRLNLTIIFVVPQGGQTAQMAARNGFPVYLSMDNLANAISAGQLVRQRTLTRNTAPLNKQAPNEWIRMTHPLPPLENASEGPVTPLPFAPESAPVPMFSSQQEERISWPPESLRRTSQPLEPLGRASRPLEESLGWNAQASWPPEPLGRTSQPLFQTQADPKVQTSQPLPPLPNITQPPPQPRRFPLLLTVLTIALLCGIIGSFLVLPRAFQITSPATKKGPAAPVNVGSVTYASSEQINDTSNQGIADQIVINLHGITPPDPNKKYYGWLLGDQNQGDPTTVALGALPFQGGNISYTYAGDAQHTNLLATTSRFLITEEDGAVPPISPSVDPATWRYYAAFPDTPIKSAEGGQQYSYLDHLRHLLAADPTLDELDLPGGLNTWLYKNTDKIVEWSGSMRESWEGTKDTGFVRRQTTRILTYLDGTTFLSQDLPKNQPLLVNERNARIGLLDVAGADQEPPSYLQHIDKHLRGLLQSDSAPDTLRPQMQAMMTAMSNVQLWLTNVRSDAQKIVKMSDAQMRQSPDTLNLINGMIDNANNAFAGQLDPTTGQTLQGVNWLHEHMNALATLEIAPVKPNSSGLVLPLVPKQKQAEALIPIKHEDIQ